MINNVDVCIETHIQTVETILLGSALTIGITQREVVHTDIITTLHIDIVVLSHGCTIYLLSPVCIIVIHGIVIL